uniref:Uncharacterized protein n=1 Tax=Glossina austeni TaxID=7395 RepID=A0A1A9UTT8_GLOAU
MFQICTKKENEVNIPKGNPQGDATLEVEEEIENVFISKDSSGTGNIFTEDEGVLFGFEPESLKYRKRELNLLRLSGTTGRCFQALIKGDTRRRVMATREAFENANTKIGRKWTRLVDSTASSPRNPSKHPAAGTRRTPNGTMESTATLAAGTSSSHKEMAELTRIRIFHSSAPRRHGTEGDTKCFPG